MSRSALLSLLSLALPAAAQNGPPAPPPAAQEPASDELQHAFAIPETRLAKTRIEHATEHIAAARWSEAFEELQRLIEEHRGEMLAGEKQLPRRARPSVQPVHPGASQRAREMLFALPAEARALYQARFAAQAGAALAHARAQRDRRELAEIGRRWPITNEAELAWWTLGDLELEEGRAREARLAWSRALSVRLLRPELELVSADDWNGAAAALESGDARAKAAAQRARAAAALAADTRADSARTEEETLGSLHNGVAGRTNVAGPGRGASSWAQPYRLEDPLPGQIARLDSFFLARSGDLLYLNPPLRVVALNAWTGAPVWQSEEPEGWRALGSSRRSELFTGLDEEASMYAPAASARVVVGVLQLPFSLTQTQYFGQIAITKPIPQKRLFAFDARTGKPLWDHRPPASWDGGPAPFEQRMIVAGPPVIAGDRVLAPLYLSEGRIDYHVGCFDLETGALLWARALVSGQRELNMFGRTPHEFSAPPLLVDGARVFALTQLGTVAALDLFSGDVLWQTRYEQIVIPKNTSMEASPMRNDWRASAPVVSGRTLIATPFDSPDMIGIDCTSGALVWSQPSSFFVAQGATKYRSSKLLFLGASERSVYVMGQAIVGLSSRAGLEREAPTAPDFLFTSPDLQRNGGALGRPVVAGKRLVVPLLDERVDLELPAGRELPRVPWANGLSGGNLLVGRGELFTLSRNAVEGYFEWQQMVERARSEHERAPGDASATELFCQLLGTAADNALADGKSETARAAIEEARRTLESFPHTGDALPPMLAARLHRTLRIEARVREALADGEHARAALELARTNAPSPEDLRDTLLEELALLPPRSNARAEILAVLEQQVPDLALECVQPVPADGRAPDAFEWLPATPRAGGAETEAHTLELPVGLWVLLDRCSAARRARAGTAELECLETILALHASFALPAGNAGVLARARVAELYAASAKDALEPYEQRAAAALAAARAKSDREALARIPEFYPCTRAATQANDARVELALANGSPGELLAILAGELHGEWRLASAGKRELELLARAALGFERAGHTELSAELLRTLAAARPDFVPAAPEAGGRDLAALGAGRVRWTPAETAAPIGRFAPDTPRLWALDGRYQILGRTLPDDPAAERLQLVAGTERNADGCELRAWSGANLEQPLWAADVSLMTETGRLDAGSWRTRLACARGRVLLAGLAGVVGLDERSGLPDWQWVMHSPGLQCAGLTIASGIALVALRPDADSSEAGDWLQALDARDGAPLWRIRAPSSGVRALPLCSSNTLVFLPPNGTRDLALHDLFTGARVGGITLEQPVFAKFEEDAWIEGERLILPWIENKRALLECWDLAQQKRSWRLDLNEGASEARQLAGVLQSGARTWLYLKPMGGGANTNSNPNLAELSTGIGALSPLSNVRLAPGDRLLGPLAQKRRRLPSTELYFLSERPQAKEETRVRCIDLAAGERWAATLHAPFAELTRTLTPAPALSADGVVLAYTPNARPERPGSVGANVVFLDRANGLVRADKRALGQEAFGRSDALEFVPLGDGLLVRGQDRLEVWR